MFAVFICSAILLALRGSRVEVITFGQLKVFQRVIHASLAAPAWGR